MTVVVEAIKEVERKRKEERRQEIVKEIEGHIATYVGGGPDRREWDVELGKEVFLSAMMIEEQWDWAYQERLKQRAGGKPQEKLKPESPEEEPKKAAVKSPVAVAAPAAGGFVRRIGGPYRGPSQEQIIQNMMKATVKPVLKVVEQRKAEPEAEPQKEEPKKGGGGI
jgi:hypothetical protein